MNSNDGQNVRRVLRVMAREWGCPIWIAERTIRESIDRCWEEALLDPETKALWDRYFPDGKPTPEQYILRLGHAHEKGENVPYLLK